MVKSFNADLHIHTCLSPCADLTMSPKRVVGRALEEDLDIIAICDHNSAENVEAAKNAAEEKELTVMAGMEINSREEVHVIAIFDQIQQVLKLQNIVYDNLPPEENKEELFGQQIIANELDEVEGFNKKLLIAATDLTLNEIVENIHQLKGLAIAAHVDRESYSIIAQLGFIPEKLELDAVEISSHISIEKAMEKFPQLRKFPVITSSDAHFLQDIRKVSTIFTVEKPVIDEIRMALKNQQGRSFKIGA